jgi:hypothetical protein
MASDITIAYVTSQSLRRLGVGGRPTLYLIVFTTILGRDGILNTIVNMLKEQGVTGEMITATDFTPYALLERVCPILGPERAVQFKALVDAWTLNPPKDGKLELVQLD